MNAERDVERLIADWLVEESPRRAPDRILTDAADVIDRTKQRRLGVVWRLPPMLSNRLASAAAFVVLVATSALAITKFAAVGPPGPSPSPTTGASVGPTAAPTSALPAARALAPTAVIDLAGMVKDTIPLTTNGKDLWIGVDGAVIHVDGTTNATLRIAIPDLRTGNGHIAITPEGLWIDDYAGNRIERFDPATGTRQFTENVSAPKTITFTDGQLWIGAKGEPGAYQVDRATGALGQRIGTAISFSIGLGSVWMGGLTPNQITRVDAATGAAAGTFDVPAGTGCTVGGSFPDNIWASCVPDFGTCPPGSTAVRIDPATNRVVTTARICSAAVAVIDGTPWFLAGRKDGDKIANSLVSVDPATGQWLAQLDLGDVDYDEVVQSDTALWISDEQGDRVLRYDFTALHP